MRINTNIAALRTTYQLGRTESMLNTSLQKLSSGNKLVDIKENPVGASLSVKMKTQIRNLDRASQNTSDGISIVTTAEGALAEIESMIQRINELAVQGANETFADDDRQGIMDEINQLNDEIDRISRDTDFNTKTLLDGNLQRRTYSDRVEANVTAIEEGVPAGEYTFTCDNSATQATQTVTGFAEPNTITGSIYLNGAQIQLEEGDTLTDIYNKFMQAGDKTGISVELDTANPSIKCTQTLYGSNRFVKIEANEYVANELGIQKETITYGTDSVVTIDRDNSDFSNNASWTADGREITFRDANDFEFTVNVEGENPDTYTIGVTDIGPMVIQVGANEYQELNIEIPKINSETLGLSKIRAYTADGAGEAITIANNAIARVSEIRSSLGAYQNRMEHTVETLDLTEENMTASLSRIEDVDIADEMTKYTTYNVMSQAATSMLAQANQLPDKVLQLLQ